MTRFECRVAKLTKEALNNKKKQKKKIWTAYGM
jgi:hypothetical protein